MLAQSGGEHDAALICAAVNSLPSLLDEHERAMAVVRKVASRAYCYTIKEDGEPLDLCFYCNGCCYMIGEETHAPGCAWVAARKLADLAH